MQYDKARPAKPDALLFMPAPFSRAWWLSIESVNAVTSPLPLAGEIDALGSAIARLSAAGGGRPIRSTAFCGTTPTPTLPASGGGSALSLPRQLNLISSCSCLAPQKGGEGAEDLNSSSPAGNRPCRVDGTPRRRGRWRGACKDPTRSSTPPAS